ncbi:hypothetical protein PHYC_03734 [Phycisphaerales bacterium]|nr:hypothetical protein PHYC_03734 [Phycisphaerales bacterium]
MKTLKPLHLLALAGLALASLTAPVAAQTENPPPAVVPADPTNAALVYWRAWSLEPTNLADDIKNKFDSAKAVDPKGELAELLRKPETTQVIRQLLHASGLPECDFGIVYSEGFMALLPHLSKFRASARLLAADSALATAEGRMDDAAERIAAIYRMSRQLSREGILISSLVSPAVGGLAHAQVKTIADAGKFSPAQAAALVAELDAYSTADPFGMRRSLETEGSVMTAWIEKNFTGPDAGARLADSLVNDAQLDSDTPVEGIRILNEEALHATTVQIRQYYRMCLEVFDLPDAEDRLNALAKDVADGKFGPLAHVMAPAVTKIVAADRKCRNELASSRQILSEVK